MSTALSIIIPVLNEGPIIRDQIARLQAIRSRGAELIVVDGGSVDETQEIAGSLADEFIVAPRGRASQMNAGARLARGNVILFLHADTTLPDGADLLISAAFTRTDRVWGRFDVQIVPDGFVLGLVGRMMNWRSRLSGIATGDQAIFVLRRALLRVGGYPDIALMEDIAISKALKRISPPICLREVVCTSARRWRQSGIARTILMMWCLRLAHFCGANTEALARRYGYVPRKR